jgi:hypothetical protein
MTRKKSSLKASFRRMKDIAPNEILQMHGLFQGFYEHADMNTFVRDLSKKTGAVLVHDKKSGQLMGFSTVAEIPLWDGEQEAIGVFSGDTIMHPDHWGDRALKDGFAGYMARTMVMNPLTPVYWLLISKGYKTYLLLANNFLDYYPRHDKPNDPKHRRLIEAYCNKLFPGKYDAEREVLDFGQNSQCLKDDVAPITAEMARLNPAIGYFEERNPEWWRGVELPCIAEANMGLVLRYLDKQRKKMLGKTESKPSYMEESIAPNESGYWSRKSPSESAPSERGARRAGNE